MGLRWEVGITTCVPRLFTTLPATVESLAHAGFAPPRIFLDGETAVLPVWLRHYRIHHRETPVFAFGNWSLALYEMLTISPDCDRYAIFQDDVLLCKNVRQYLDSIPWKPRTYVNLITYPENRGNDGWNVANGRGKGAQALVFDRAAVVDLLSDRKFLERRFDLTKDADGLVRGRKNIDGAVHHALVEEHKYQELVHTPSLASHRIDVPSAIRNRKQPPIEGWPGENWDVCELLKATISP